MSIFSSVATKKRGRTKFNLDHDVKLSFDMADLIPVMNMEVVPGDDITVRQETLIRMAPMLAPVMHKVHVTTHFFFVPYRILWNNWDNFMTNTKVGGVVPAAPYFSVPSNVATAKVGTLWDYLGLPTHLNTGSYPNVSALHFNAYQKIYDEYYRAQYIEGSDYTPLVDGINTFGSTGTSGNSVLRKRAWQHDYFTSALPFAQAGDAVTLPLVTNQEDLFVRRNSTVDDNTRRIWDSDTPAGNPMSVLGSRDMETSDGLAAQGDLFVEASDLNDNASTINEIRKAIRVQEYLEAKARGGSRAAEWLLSMFGVNSGDARLNRPEFLGGNKQNVVISEVLQTSATDVTGSSTPLADMAGHGVSVGSSGNIHLKAKEFGVLMGIMSVMPVTAYQQGVPRKFSRFDPLDLYNPHFANLGEQEIKNKELYVVGDIPAENEQTFGYTPRYSELKYENSRVAGDFRESLDFWHFGRKFTERPSLNSSFIRPNNVTKRPFAVQSPTLDSLWSQVFFDVKASRKMPYYGTPKL